MNYIKPKPLDKGSTIAFISPAGGVNDKDMVLKAKDYFENLGYNVVFSEHIFNRHKYMSDTDENRLADLHWAFLNPDIDGIICTRGGYGCLRLLDKIDYELIKKNPKVFCGYSDITILSAAFLKKAGLITYSGPMARGDFGREDSSDYTLDYFNKTVIRKENLEFNAEKTYNSGNSTGTMFGGNLASILSLCGTDFLPNEGFIFFAEDLNEPVYKIDRMFTQLLNIKDFSSNIKGLILGDFLDSGYPEQLDELFTEIGNELNIPVLGGFKITHNKDKITIPVGGKGEILNSRLIINQY